MTLLYLSSRFLDFFRLGRSSQDSEDTPGQIAVDAAPDLLVNLALGATFLDVVSGFGVLSPVCRVQGDQLQWT